METINVLPITSTVGSIDIHIWQDGEGWWICRSGEYRGISSESDDLGPFSSWIEAIEAQKDELSEQLQEILNLKIAIDALNLKILADNCRWDI